MLSAQVAVSTSQKNSDNLTVYFAAAVTMGANSIVYGNLQAVAAVTLSHCPDCRDRICCGFRFNRYLCNFKRIGGGGQIFAADMTGTTPQKITMAISDIETVYTDAAGRALDFTELGNGGISSMILAPGIYNVGC